MTRHGPARALRDGLAAAASSTVAEGAAHAGDGRGVGPGGRRHRGGAGGAAARPRPRAVVRHGRHHRQGQPDRATDSIEHHVGVRGRRRRQRAAAGCTARAIRSACPSSTSPRFSAGGGSIAWIDPGGALRVGPYERGRRARSRLLRAGGDASPPSPTPTSCSAISNPWPLLGGDAARRTSIGRAAAIEARDRASPSGVGVRDGGGRRSSTSSMPAWPRRSASSPSQRGHDPREFALVAFGGAGPAARGARSPRSSSIPRVICPAHSRRLLRARASSAATSAATTCGRSTRGLAAASLAEMARGVRRLEAEARQMLDARRRARSRAGEIDARRRLPLRAPGLRAGGAGGAGRDHAGGDGGARPRLPRPAPDDLRPRQPRTSRCRSSTCASPRWASSPTSISGGPPRAGRRRRGHAGAARDGVVSRRPGSCAADVLRPRRRIAAGAAGDRPRRSMRVDRHHRGRRRRAGAGSADDGGFCSSSEAEARGGASRWLTSIPPPSRS